MNGYTGGGFTFPAPDENPSTDLEPFQAPDFMELVTAYRSWILVDEKSGYKPGGELFLP